MSSENIEEGKQFTQLLQKADPQQTKSDRHSVPPGGADSEDALGKSILDDLDKDALPGSRKRSIWEGWNGSFVMMFGVWLPLLTILLGCASCPKRVTLVALNHPLETIAEVFLLFAVPLINYRVWSALCADTLRFSPFPRRRATFLGLALGTSLVSCAISFAGLIIAPRALGSELGTAFDTGFVIIAGLSLLAGFVSVYLINELRRIKTFAKWQIRTVFYAAIGFAISALAFIAAEARPLCIRIAEKMAVANSPKERKEGLYRLRQLNPERELRLECSDSRAAGISGLFIPLKTNSQKQLYFALTGKPFSFKDCTNTDLSSMPDDYLGRNVVGERKPGLSLARSSMTGTVHPDTLTSTIDWTLVLRNDEVRPEEGRAEIKVPRGAVVTGLTCWSDGKPEEASCVASGKVADEIRLIDAKQGVPAMVTELRQDRLFLHCFQIAPEDELKVRVTTVVPLVPEGLTTASFVLPRFVATNFDLSGEENSLRLRSSKQLTGSLANFKQGRNMKGDQLLFGTFAENQLDSSDLTVIADRTPATEAMIALDERATQNAGAPQYVVESVVPRKTAIPEHLVLIIDGSSSMKKYAGELQDALSKLPTNVRASLIIASQGQEAFAQPVGLSQGLKNLSKVQFVGGQDNLKAVVKAAELAGEDEGGAVLWIHGPQSVENRELYIIPSYTAAPRFYELALDSGDTDTYELFKNHSEIGPFVQVPHCSSVSADLERFISKWKPNSEEYSVAISQTTSKSSKNEVLSRLQSREIIALHASQQCLRLIACRQRREAAQMAVAYGIVTPVSSVLIAEPNSIATTETQSGSAPRLQGARPQLQLDDNATFRSADAQALHMQGAINGTIGPQMDDATFVRGVNTAGTVRVNNLANLEAFLSILANGIEILAIAWGGPTMIVGFMHMASNTKGAMQKVLLGAAGVTGGLVTPGSVNWLLASARDANLFS